MDYNSCNVEVRDFCIGIHIVIWKIKKRIEEDERMKTKNMGEVLDKASEALGRKRSDSIKNNICVKCGKEAKEFKSDISKREYTISGFCQVCQDEIFK